MSADSFYDEVNLKDLPLKCQISEVYFSAIPRPVRKALCVMYQDTLIN